MNKFLLLFFLCYTYMVDSIVLFKRLEVYCEIKKMGKSNIIYYKLFDSFFS